MSDGPHRSLPLGRRWKKVAECLDIASMPIDDIRLRLDAALLSDFRSVPEALLAAMRRVLCDSDQGHLFAASNTEIENLRKLTSGSSLGGLMVDCAIGAVLSGETGEAALESALGAASQEWMDRHCRGMDEHYQRRAGATRASEFHSRVDAMQKSYSLPQIARRLIDGGKAMAIKAPPKRTGLDEGVSLG
jgi:hypothetical protein